MFLLKKQSLRTELNETGYQTKLIKKPVEGNADATDNTFYTLSSNKSIKLC